MQRNGAFLMSREIFDNPIWSDPLKFRLFFFIVGNAVFSDDGVNYGGIQVERGQFLKSLRNLQDDLTYREGRGNAIKKPSLETLRRKIKELEKEGRITTKSTEFGTLFTVVNYDKYQGVENYKNNKMRQQWDSDETALGQQWDNNNNDNNVNIYTVFEHWNSKKIIVHKKLNKQMESRINARLQEHTLEELLRAIDNYHEILTNDKYFWSYKWTLQDFMKPNNVIRFMDQSEPFKTFLAKKQREEPKRTDIPARKIIDFSEGEDWN